MGPIWGRQDPGGAHVGPMNFAIWEAHLNSRDVSRDRVHHFNDVIGANDVFFNQDLRIS